LRLYEDEGHGFARLENLFDAYRRVVTFLDRELKGRTRQAWEAPRTPGAPGRPRR